MDFKEYSELAARTECLNRLSMDRKLNAALGLAGEAGEVADLIKKWIFHDRYSNKEEVAKELGDVLWYINSMCLAVGVTLESVAVGNIEKLKRRYPNGFTSHDNTLASRKEDP
jgi:NTP pyrophosphatase (non-canonical NTP hydrolase)